MVGAIFLLLALSPNASATDAMETSAAVMNMRLYACASGNCPGMPGIEAWFICWNNPARDGPIDIPIRFINNVIPRAIPVDFIGADKSTTLKPPVIESDRPDAMTARAAETINSLE